MKDYKKPTKTPAEYFFGDGSSNCLDLTPIEILETVERHGGIEPASKAEIQQAEPDHLDSLHVRVFFRDTILQLALESQAEGERLLSIAARAREMIAD